MGGAKLRCDDFGGGLFYCSDDDHIIECYVEDCKVVRCKVVAVVVRKRYRG